MSDKQETDETVKLWLPQALGSALKLKTKADMNTTIDIRRTFNSAFMAIVTCLVSIVLGAAGVVFGIVADIVYGVFRVMMNIIIMVCSVIAFIALFLWLLSL